MAARAGEVWGSASIFACPIAAAWRSSPTSPEWCLSPPATVRSAAPARSSAPRMADKAGRRCLCPLNPTRRYGLARPPRRTPTGFSPAVTMAKYSRAKTPATPGSNCAASSARSAPWPGRRINRPTSRSLASLGPPEMPRLSYVHGASRTRLIGETIGVHFDRIAERFGVRDALVVRHQQVRWTYRELKERVDAFAAGLLALGLERGDRIGVWSPNNAEWVITQFATAKAGLILVNINPAYRLAELEYALNKAGCVALVTAAQFKTSDYIGMLRDLAPELATASPGNLHAARLPELRLIITIGPGENGESEKGMVPFPDVASLGGDAEHR